MCYFQVKQLLKEFVGKKYIDRSEADLIIAKLALNEVSFPTYSPVEFKKITASLVAEYPDLLEKTATEGEGWAVKERRRLDDICFEAIFAAMQVENACAKNRLGYNVQVAMSLVLRLIK